MTILHWLSVKNPCHFHSLHNVTGFNVNLQDIDEHTPLHLICIVAFDIAVKGYEWQDTSQISTDHCCMERIMVCCHVVKFLIDRGANINIQDQNGDTPLHFALLKSSLYQDSYPAIIFTFIVEYLMCQCQARYDIPNHDHDTAWQYAIQLQLSPRL
jgi:Ankyrin repeats (many copies)